MLPKFLKEKYNIEIVDRLIRTEINGREVNFFAKAMKEGREVFVIGESTLRFDSKKKLSQIMKSLENIMGTLRGEIVPTLVTHYTKPKLKEEAKKEVFSLFRALNGFDHKSSAALVARCDLSPFMRNTVEAFSSPANFEEA